MSLHIGDYRKDTGHLRAIHHGAYLLLIMHYWATGGLPDDDQQLAAVACMSNAQWKKIRPIIVRFFGPNWTHKRIDAEIAEAIEKYRKRASAGKRGGEQKSSNATAKPKQPITLTNNLEKESGGGSARAREVGDPVSLISNEAMALADDLAVIAGHDPKFLPPGFCGAAMRIQAWLSNGWTREIILIGAKTAMTSKRDGPPSSVSYFERPITRALAQQNAPLPTNVEASNAAPSSRFSATSFQSSRDAFRAAHADLKAHIAGAATPIDDGQEGGEQVIRAAATA